MILGHILLFIVGIVLVAVAVIGDYRDNRKG